MSPEQTILSHYHAASDEARAQGADWYPEAKKLARRMARRHGITVGQAAGIIAAASLNQGWKGNQTIAEKLCAGELTGLMRVRAECAAILHGVAPVDAIHGPKRVNFYRNIMGNEHAVTVDRWAARATGDEKTLSKRGGYNRIGNAYRLAAHKAGIAARDLQAIVWIQVRGSHA